MRKVNWSIRMFYAMLTDPQFSFNYFNRDNRTSVKKGGKPWKIMKSQLDYQFSLLLDYMEVVIATGRGTGKCQIGSTLITLQDGTQVQIKDLPNTFKTLTFTDDNEVKYINANKFYNGIEDVYEIKLEGGITQSVTSEHPFLTSGGRWIHAKDLKPGDYLIQPKQLPEPLNSINVCDEELKLIGYLLGDGCISKKACSFTNINQDIINEMNKILVYYNCTLKKQSSINHVSGNYRISLTETDRTKLKNKHLVRKIIKKIGLYNTNSHTKFIPDKYFKCNNDKLALLLNRLFACDGWYYRNTIGYCTVSKRMMKQVQYLLLRYGIKSSYTKKKVKYNGGFKYAYQMSITANYVREFYEKIGVFTKLTNENTIHLKNLNNQKYLVPIDKKTYKELNSKRIYSSHISRKSNCELKKCYKSYEEDKLKKFLKLNELTEYKNLYKNIMYTKVKSIKNIGEHKTYGIEVPGTHTHVIEGIVSHNSSSISHMLFMIALTNPRKWSGMVLPNAKHANNIIQSLTDYFNKDPFVRELFIGYDKKDRIFNFKNGHKIEIRIVGHDKTGERTMVSAHYDFLFVDEAQLLARPILYELLPTMKEGARIIISGVPNDIRDTILYYYVSNKSAMYYRYATHEMDDWDEEKERRTIDLYGGKHTPSWRNLCDGLWGDHASSVFRPSKLVDSLINNDFFRYKTYNGNSFDELYQQMNLPILRSKYNFFIIGGDMGYTSNSPSHIIVLGAYDKKDRSDPEAGPVQHYDVIYRLEIENMASYNMAKSMNYLIDYFNCKHFAIDTQTFGHQVYDHLIDREIFPGTYRRNKMYIYPAIFTRPVVMGTIDTVDQTTGQPVEEEIRYAEKVAGTTKMVELVEDGRFHIAHVDSGAEDYDDLVTVMMAETQTPSMRRLHPFTYSNSVNEHAVDALRCCALVIFQIIEKGISRYGYAKGGAKPIRLGKNVFKPNVKRKSRRDRHHV